MGEDDFIGDDGFLLAKVISGTDVKTKPKVGGWSEREFINFEFVPEDEEWANKRITNQVKDTVSILEKKTLRQGDQIFYVIHPKIEPSSFEVRNLLERLDAEVLAYLDNEKNKLLVSGSNRTLVKLSIQKIPKKVGDFLYMIKPLLPNNQISEKFQNQTETIKPMVVFSLIPNLQSERIEQYIVQVFGFLNARNCKIYEENFAKQGFIFSDVDIQVINDLVNASTFIYRVDPVPDGIAEEIRQKHKGKTIKKVVIATPASFTTGMSQEDNLPSVVVMDTGVNIVGDLNQIVELDSFGFTNPDDAFDGEGHGTPIAHLVAYGEHDSNPMSKIISYKIFSNDRKNVVFRGFIEAINKYSDKTRLFITSIGLAGLPDNQIVYLDQLIQKKNICFVSSAGNIDPDRIINYVKNGSHYPQYLKYNPVIPPANALNIVAVGSITKKVSTKYHSLAPVNSISPHSTCGAGAFLLYECKKPDLVEHGGNVNIDDHFQLNTREVGVKSITKHGNIIDSFSGSSFASPILIRRLAEIERKYGSNIKNAETLKAITFLSCSQMDSTCGGYGEPKSFIGCGKNHALYLAEGALGLSDSTKKSLIESPYNEIIIYVPPYVSEIKLCVVHSDDFTKSVNPTLNTYVDIEARKMGSNSLVVSSNKNDRKRKTNVKIMSFSFDSHSMESIWRFRLIPHETEPLLPNDRKNITVRYGCAILLVRNKSHISKTSLTEEINTRKMLYSI